MNILNLIPKTPRGKQILTSHGTEWLVIEDRGTRLILTDLDEKFQMSYPNPHVEVEQGEAA